MRAARTRHVVVGAAIGALVALALSPVAPAAAIEDPVPPIEVTRLIEEPTPNIVGGNEATPGEYPFAVDIDLSIYASYTDYSTWITYSVTVGRQCAGTLIDDGWVLTAAHCFNSVTLDDPYYPYGTFRGSVHVDDLEMHIGRHDLTTTLGETFGASAVFVHPDYPGGDGSPYDIALVRLDGTSSYSAVALAGPGDAPLYSGGTTATAIGWGHTSDGGTSSDVLLEVAIPTLSDATCTTIHGADFFPSIELCAGDIYNGGEDTCQGDSGGPLLVPGGSGWLQAGVTSWGISCGTIVPGVYTEVAAFRDWIDETMAITPFVAADPIAMEFDPTGSHLVYWTENGSGERTPYSIPVQGGTPVALGTAVPSFENPYVAFTSDGSTVVYGIADAYTNTIDIFAVPITGPSSSRVLLVDDLPWGDDRYDWKLSPNDEELVYRTDSEGDLQWHIYRVALADGTSQIVTGAMIALGDATGFDISSDGRYVIWSGDPEINEQHDLTVRDLETLDTWRLSNRTYGDVERFLVSPDGTRVVYTASLAGVPQGMFSITVTGSPGEEIKIADGSPRLHVAPSGAWEITADSALVVYERTDYSDHAFYSVPIAGSPADEVELTTGVDWINGWEVSPDGAYLVVEGDMGADDVLISVPVTGPASAMVDLNTTGYWNFEYSVSPRGDLVAFVPGNTDQLLLIPIGGPASAADPLTPEYGVDDFMWSSDGSTLLFRDWNDLNAVDVDGSRNPVEISGYMQIDGHVRWTDEVAPAITPNGGIAAFVADVRIDEQREVWRVATNGEELGNAPIAVADAYRVLAGVPYTSPAPGVLGNDTDADGDGLTASLVTPPAVGDVTLHANGSFTYTRATAGLETFTYTVSDGQWTSQPATVTIRTVEVPDYSTMDVLTGDFTGDGVDDVATFDPATGNWTVGVIGSEFTHTVWATFSPSITLTTTMVGDFNGDGKDDLANFDAATGKWWISISTGDSFATSAWMTFSLGIVLSNQFVGDFDGDGIDDLANFEVTTGKWFVSLSRPDIERFATSQWSKFTASLELPSQFVGDFNGDGKDDLANYHLASGKWFISTSTGSSFATAPWMKFTPGTEFFSQFVGDFNGDGIDDLANYQIETGKWFLSISNGSGGFATAVWSRFTPSIVISSQFIGDFNGDGMSDLANFEVTTGKWFISISTGNQRFLTSMWSKFTPSLVLDPQLIGDFGGDGMDDLLNCQMPIGKLWISQSTGSGFATAPYGHLPY